MPRTPRPVPREEAHAPDGDPLPLPHERDQKTGEVAEAVDPVIAQAGRDIEAGLVDTDMRATPGLDAKRRAELVPTPAPQGRTRKPR